MAVRSQHPVSAPPVAPVREKTGRLALRAWCIFVLFLALSGTSWINLIGQDLTIVLTIASGVVTAVLWLLVRPPVQGRRMPWMSLAYVAWAALSLLWSQWPGATALTWLLLAITTLHGLFVAAVLTWRELVRALASALKWCVGLSALFELAVVAFVHGPLLPQFMLPAQGTHYDPIVYWSRGNLLNGGRIQGIFGNANLLAAVCLVAIIVFAVRIALKAPRRGMLWAWLVLSAYLLVRASSATMYLSAVAAAIVLLCMLLVRRAATPRARGRLYAIFIVAGAVLLAAALLWRDALFQAFGRSADLTGRGWIWADVLTRTAQRPVTGWGFSTPWIPTDPHFAGWIVDHGQTVMQAHNMWVDASMQLGIVGVLILALMYLAFIWRSWFFAVDRPRWDLRADRPYSALTMLPTLIAAVLIVQGLAESEPLLLWGWMFVVMFSFKIKQSPLVGVGSIEERMAIERGDTVHASMHEGRS